MVTLRCAHAGWLYTVTESCGQCHFAEPMVPKMFSTLTVGLLLSASLPPYKLMDADLCRISNVSGEVADPQQH